MNPFWIGFACGFFIAPFVIVLAVSIWAFSCAELTKGGDDVAITAR